ncbi:MAG: gyrase subunit [Candidatus Woesearchaeota archaeon]|nr:gyrase subunit [Candidatus Woesearchaeota archaeon]
MTEEKEGTISEREIEEEMKSSYIDYAMSVIIGRAIPDVRDGLKPVHRRILYSMKELGVLHNTSYKKSARIVGDCMGKYHPHGDAAIYDALTRMAQPFSMRYPFVDGHGNFGSVDGDSPAAMRYTEARLSKIAEEMLSDIDKDTVDFIDNFDGSLKEPVVLPAKFPSLLVNGSSGIAVGMATNIPPHNIKEACNAVIAVIDNPEISFEEIMKIIPAPDFPTGGVIIGRSNIIKAMRTGRGSLIVRGKYTVEEDDKYRRFVINEIPPFLNKATMVEKIAEAVMDKRISGVRDIRDESNKDGIRIVLELSNSTNIEVLKNQLCKHSSFQTTFGVNMVAIVGKRPVTLNIKGLLEEFIKHREEVITRRTRFELNKAKQRAEVLEGLLIALENLDEIIGLIKKANNADEARKNLKARFPLTDLQTDSILKMRLQSLTALERNKIKDEHSEILSKIKEYETILSDRKNILQIIKDEQLEMIKEYGDERRTEIVDDEEGIDIDYEELLDEEDIVVLLTNKGYIKRLPLTEYKTQRRGGKGIISTNTIQEDFVKQIIYTTTHSYLLLFTNKGRVYWLKSYLVPEEKRYSRGIPIINMLNLSEKEEISVALTIKDIEKEGYLVMATKKGYVKKTKISNFSNPRKGGIIALSLNNGDNLVNVVKTDGMQDIMLFTKKGFAVRFNENKIRASGRTSIGVRGIKLRDDDEVISIANISSNERILSISQRGFGKRTDVQEYRETNRGGKGVINMKINKKTGDVACVNAVMPGDEIIIVTTKGITIRTRVDEISEVGRHAMGVRTIRLDDDDEVKGLTIISNLEEITREIKNNEE